MPGPSPRFVSAPIRAPVHHTFGQIAAAQAVTPYRPRLMALLVIAYGLLAIVPVQPWPAPPDPDAVQTAGAAEGGSLESLLLLGLFALASLVLIERRHLALTLLARSWPLALTLGWFLLSTAWSHFPDLTVKRTAFLVIGYLISVGIASGASSPWHVLRPLAVCFQLVLLVDLVSVFIIPDRAITAIGAAGMHGNKNVAGSIAMIGILVSTVVVLYGGQRWLSVLIGVGLLPSLLFLVLTESKTCIALVALFYVYILPFCVVLSAHRPLGASMLLLAGFGVSLFLFAAGLMRWDRADILEVLVGDPTFTGRTDIWDFVWPFIQESPVLGTGYGAFWDVGSDQDPLRNARSWLGEVAQGVINQTHNGYIDILLQAGMVGLAGLLLILGWGLMRSGAAMVRQPVGSRRWAPHALVFALLCLFVVYNLMETGLLSRVHLSNQFFVLFLVLTERWQIADAQVWPGWGRVRAASASGRSG